MFKMIKQKQKNKASNIPTMMVDNSSGNMMIENTDNNVNTQQEEKIEDNKINGVDNSPATQFDNTSLTTEENLNTIGDDPNNKHIIEHGGLHGNPGQLQRFNRLIESKSGDTNKYFWSGKK